ncbi:hypothetical protein Leryth_020599 [Lithospermum erythrorhizon]|nr:hypothetical protein Leryth_020599 [Lithospermum erythrorhizon]
MTVDDNRSIYVGGLSYNVTEQTLRRAFNSYGPIIAVKIINDQAVGGKCYGFVTFKNPRSAMHAIDAMDGRNIEGRVVRVNEVKTRAGRSNFGQNEMKTRGGRSNFGRESFRQSYERGAGGDRSRSRERLYQRDAGGFRSRSRERVHEYNRDLHRDAQGERFQDRDQYNDRGSNCLHNQERTLEHMAGDRDEDHQPDMGNVEREHDRNHEQEWENNNKTDMETSRDLGRSRKNDNGTDERPNSVDGFSHDIHSDREFSSKGDRHDQVERQLEIASQKVEDLQQEITSMKETAEEKKHTILKLQEKAQMLKDAVTATRKLKSHRQVQLSELHKCYEQVNEYTERLKNSEQTLQSLVDSTNLGDEL